MFLLRFTFENHKSFRDEVDLTMVLPSLRTSVPKSGSWKDHTARVAAIYGANASGKSSVLDALRFMQASVRSSAPAGDRKRLPQHPFGLDDESKTRSSTYVLDFVLGGVRHEYGFVIGRKRFEEEWLYTFPTGRKRVVFERSADPTALDFGRELGGGGPHLARTTHPRELVLSNARLLKHPTLMPIADAFSDAIDIASFGESDRKNRLRSVIRDVADGRLSMDNLRTMLRVADIGIMDAEVEDPEANPQIVKVFRAFVKAQKSALAEVRDGGGDADGHGNSAPSKENRAASEAQPSNSDGESRDGAEDDDDDPSGLTDEEVEALYVEMSRSLMFKHAGVGARSYDLPSDDQSTGTLTWLSLAAPAIATIRKGGVLAVDELDASLHPQLAQVMIQMFRDESINAAGAQLIFTTHDTYFMSPTSDVKLQPEEVWFVEKNREGVSDLFRLSDFPTRGDQNLSRRYLQGRYGAIPSVAPSFLAALTQSSSDESETERELV